MMHGPINIRFIITVTLYIVYTSVNIFTMPTIMYPYIHTPTAILSQTVYAATNTHCLHRIL